MRSMGGWGVLPLVLACSFDATGVDTVAPASAAEATVAGSSGGSTSAAPGTSTTSAAGTSGATEAAEATGDPTTDGQSGTDPATSEPLTTGPMETTAPDTTDGTTTDGTTTGVPETTGPPVCDAMVVKEILLVVDAVITVPMEKVMSGKGEGMVALSEVAEEGTVSFSVDLPCDGTYAVWGRAQDTNPGNVDADPDSYFVRVDGGGEGGWFYGCQTNGLASGYHWLRVTTAGMPVCGGGVWSPQLAAGSHTFTLRNREPVAFDDDVAAVARLLITNDMNYVPQLPD